MLKKKKKKLRGGDIKQKSHEGRKHKAEVAVTYSGHLKEYLQHGVVHVLKKEKKMWGT